ncbi:MAG TPA: hypothetical protein VN181_15630 [Thermoanaerobaculia bacterium]|nr:hypothetical protein [Thermoanaerobaculia bacterium]
MLLAERWNRPDLTSPRPRIAIESMAGTWQKTNGTPQWLDSLIVDAEGDALFVTVFGSAPPSPPDWGRVKASATFGANVADAASPAGGFIAYYRFDGFNVELQANLNLGLLVVATFVHFTEPREWSDRFTREFFFRANGDGQ